MNKNVSIPLQFEKYGAIILSLFCLLAQYKLPIMSYGLVLMGVFSCVMIIKKRQIIFNKYLLFFTLYCTAVQLFVYIKTNTLFINLNTYLFMLISLPIISGAYYVDRNSLLRIYRIAGLIFGITVTIQFILANFLSLPQSAIQILPVALDDQHFWISSSKRVSGFFAEPQAYCSFIIPLIILLLNNNIIKESIFFTLTIFMTTSSQGIILSMFIWSYFLIYKKDVRNLGIMRFAILMFAFVIGALIMELPIGKFIFDKISTIDFFGYDIRLTKGFEIYGQLPMFNKLFGLGFGNLGDYLIKYGTVFDWFYLTREELITYITSMSNILVSFGFFAMIFYVKIFYKSIHKNKSFESKLLLIILFISSFTQTILFNAWFIFYWCLVSVLGNHELITIRFKNS